MKKTEIDIVILSYSANEGLKQVTSDCINSLISSQDESIEFNILVLESEKKLFPYQFEGSRTIYPEEKFNFHKYLNLGVSLTSNNLICFCNNDLIFEKGWAQSLIAAMDIDKELLSVSPLCPQFHPGVGIFPNSGLKYGYSIRKEIAGWCFMIKRELLSIIGPFDEHFSFWFADTDYSHTLKKYNIKHALVTDSMVRHLDGRSTQELEDSQKSAMTNEQFWYFQYKWEHKNRLLYFYRKLRSQIRVLFNN